MSKGSEPAYPVKCDKDDFLRVADNHFGGLTKRELIAAMALQGLLSNPHYSQQLADVDGFQGSPAQAARYHADALLSELEKTP